VPAKERKMAMRCAVGGWVLQSLSMPVNTRWMGLTMNMGAVTALAVPKGCQYSSIFSKALAKP
jgi:ATP-dependent protease ClpP protease subunit